MEGGASSRIISDDSTHPDQQNIGAHVRQLIDKTGRVERGVGLAEIGLNPADGLGHPPAGFGRWASVQVMRINPARVSMRLRPSMMIYSGGRISRTRKSSSSAHMRSTTAFTNLSPPLAAVALVGSPTVPVFEYRLNHS